MKKIPFLLLPCFVLFIACTHGSSHLAKEQPVDSLRLSHAEGFSIRYFRNYKEVVVFNPFSHNAVYQRYYLVRDTGVCVPPDGLKIKIPVRSLAATSVTHFEFLNLLHVIDAVTGVCSSKIIYSPQINERLNKGLIVDLGDAFNINLEKTVQLHPDLVMVSGYNQNDPFAQRLLQAGIFPVYNNEWMEKSLLGRAEWIKFVAAFFDREKIADSLYLEIEKEYQNTANRVKGIKFRPQIMSGSNFRGTWYMPGGRNFMAQLFSDAGGNYFYANDTTVGSLPLSFEKVLKNFSESDVWLNCNYASLSELLKADPKHALFRPVKLQQVYNFNKRMLPSGANDFWESAVAHPDIVLKDVVWALHPELLSDDYQPKYLIKLK